MEGGGVPLVFFGAKQQEKAHRSMPVGLFSSREAEDVKTDYWGEDTKREIPSRFNNTTCLLLNGCRK